MIRSATSFGLAQFCCGWVGYFYVDLYLGICSISGGWRNNKKNTYLPWGPIVFILLTILNTYSTSLVELCISCRFLYHQRNYFTQNYLSPPPRHHHAPNSYFIHTPVESDRLSMISKFCPPTSSLYHSDNP